MKALGADGRDSQRVAEASEHDKDPASSGSHPASLQNSENGTKLDLRSSDEVGNKRLDRYEAKKLAAEIQRSGEVSFTGHCQEELKKDSMDTADVLNILRCGRIEREPEPESKFGIWRYRVETHRMAAVIEIHSKTSLRVITAWRKVT